MTIDQIKYFLALAERLNFRAVAERFFITQPTLSRQISNLENEVGVKLFQRKNPNVELTAAGEAMYEGMSEVYRSYDRVLRQVQAVDEASHGRLVLAVEEDQLLNAPVLDAVKEFARRCPRVRVTLLRAPLRELRSGLLDQSLDLAVSMYLDGAHLRGLDHVTISEDPACLALSRELAAEYPHSLTPGQLEDISRKVPLHLIADDYFLVASEPAAQLRKNIHADLRDEDIRFDGSPLSIPLKISAGLCSTVLNSTHIVCIDPNIALLEIQGAASFRKILAYYPGASNLAIPQFLRILDEVLGRA